MPGNTHTPGRALIWKSPRSPPPRPLPRQGCFLRVPGVGSGGEASGPGPQSPHLGEEEGRGERSEHSLEGGGEGGVRGRGDEVIMGLAMVGDMALALPLGS